MIIINVGNKESLSEILSHVERSSIAAYLTESNNHEELVFEYAQKLLNGNKFVSKGQNFIYLLTTDSWLAKNGVYLSDIIEDDKFLNASMYKNLVLMCASVDYLSRGELNIITIPMNKKIDGRYAFNGLRHGDLYTLLGISIAEFYLLNHDGPIEALNAFKDKYGNLVNSL